MITVLRCCGDEKKSMWTADHDIDTSICLLGEFCNFIGHSLTIFQGPKSEVCPDCDFQNKIDTARWSLRVGERTYLESPRRPGSPPPPGVIRKYNNTVRTELRRNLEQCTSSSQCKVLLHYILSLPRYIEKNILIIIFANVVGSWSRDKLLKELSHIAKEHGVGRNLDSALQIELERRKRLKE